MPKMQKNLLVVVDFAAEGGAAGGSAGTAGNVGLELSSASVKLLQLARSLTSGQVVALCPDVAGAGFAVGSEPAAALAAAGATRAVLPADTPGYNSRIAAGVADFVQAAIANTAATAAEISEIGAVLLVSNYRGREVAANLAVRLGSAAIADAAGVEVSEAGLRVQKLVFSGSWSTCVQVNQGIPAIAVRPGVEPQSAEAAAPTETGMTLPLETVEFALSAAAASCTVISSQKISGAGKVNLAEADVVVVGGRGMDGDFALAESLAEALDGAVGATRVACDEGWIDRSAQIGQTGVSVAPKLYLGLGVSGATHHTCGIQGAEKIVAVCDDPDAPIFELADFGVVGDLTEVVPAALEKLAQLQAGN